MRMLDYVNIKQGSASTSRFSNGNTLPLVQRPFGMAAFAPQTDDNERWFYHPQHRSLMGVRLTRQPSPWIADYGSVSFMPQNGLLGCSGNDRWSGYRPEDAVLAPDYLKLRFLRSRSVLELATTERCAAVRVTFDKAGDNYFSVHSVKDDRTEFEFDAENNTLYVRTEMNHGGDLKRFADYVVFRFAEGSVDFDEILVGDDSSRKIHDGLSAKGDDKCIFIKLRSKVTNIQVSSSYISFEQAEITLDRELGGQTLESVRAKSAEIWEEYLSRVQIEPEDDEQLKTFCSCMYRAFLYPHRCSEINAEGKEVHYCPHDGKVYGGVRFTDNGFWDTYRTVYPFFSLVAKDELREMLRSFINDYRECGWLPRWLSIGERGCMPSTLIDAVICDGAVKGFIEMDDLETALKGMVKHATKDAPEDYFGRNGAESYCRLGYVPYDEQKESVNLTLDAAYGDWCIAEIAGLLGDEKTEKKYRARSKNYAKLFDPETGFMRARDSKGTFRPDFSPIAWGRDYTEGSAWQNSFAVPHDIEGLAELYGGKEKLIAKIDELFATAPDYEIAGYGCEIHEMTEMAAADFGQCAISNQPSFHIPYIYSALGDVEKTAYWVRKLCTEAFSYTDDGFPGDEDNGTTAIWYIFGILGFYPFCPGKPEFVKGAKQVKKAYILGKEFDADRFEKIIPYEVFTDEKAKAD